MDNNGHDDNDKVLWQQENAEHRLMVENYISEKGPDDFGSKLLLWQQEQHLKTAKQFAALTPADLERNKASQAEISRKAAESHNFMVEREAFIAAKLAAAKQSGNQDESKEARAQSLQDALRSRLKRGAAASDEET